MLSPYPLYKIRLKPYGKLYIGIPNVMHSVYLIFLIIFCQAEGGLT